MHAQHAMKSVPSMLSMRWNRFRVCSACDKIISAYACYIFRKTQNSLIKMQILPIKNSNFEKPSRNLSNRNKVKILEKNFLDICQKNLVPRMLSHRGNVRTSKFWRKSKEKKRNYFRKFTKGIWGFDLGKKKFKIISCLCTFKESIPWNWWLGASGFLSFHTHICTQKNPRCEGWIVLS
jgi:hypothetical protein